MHTFCRAFHGASFYIKLKILSFPQVESSAQQKSLRNIFILFDITIMTVVHFEHESRQVGKYLLKCFLYSLSRRILQKQSQDFIIDLRRGICQIHPEAY